MASTTIPIGAIAGRAGALNERSREIFRQIVESYLATGEPVGSRNLSRILPMTLSPASVRNVMSDLEQLGLDLCAAYLGRAAADRTRAALLRRCADADRRLTESDRRSIEAQVAGRPASRSEAVLTEASQAALRADPLGRRRADRQDQRAAQAHRVRPAGAGARAGRAGGGRWAGREPRLNVPARAADLRAGRGGNFLNARIRGKTLAELAPRSRGGRGRPGRARRADQQIIAAGLASWSGGESEDRKLIVRGHANLLETCMRRRIESPSRSPA